MRPRFSPNATFDPDIGTYPWINHHRLPFGLKVSAELFQKRVHAALSDLPGVYCIADDVLIAGFGDDLQAATVSLSDNVDCFLQCCSQKGIVLNPDKLEHAVTSIPFMGHLLTSTGLQPNPQKVDAIVNMPTPSDVTAERRFVGTVNQLAKFLPSLSAIIKPLTSLSCKDVTWTWGPEHETVVNTVKRLISRAAVLRQYNPDEELVVQCDASKDGLGACLLQQGQPITYASRTLTPAKQNYAQVEKETLAIVFAMEHFHQYTYGRSTLVHFDHKLLEAILKKPLSRAPLHLQHMLLRLQPYDITVTWTPGKKMYIADTLFRACASAPVEGNKTFIQINSI